MPIEIQTEGKLIVREIGSQKGFEMSFGGKSVLNSEELTKWISSISLLPASEGGSKIREIMRSRNEEKQAELKQVNEDLGLNEQLDPDFVRECEDLFGEVPENPPEDVDQIMEAQQEMPEPTEADRAMADAINIFDGQAITGSDEMGTEGVSLLINTAMSDVGMDFDTAKDAVRRMLTADFQVIYDEANQNVYGLTEAKYLHALSRIQKARKTA
ncbi:MAG: hypothetical protein K2Y22_04420 [Candidatus Obscuribacterales bacterium]|nr:hypothetical protein [Candidatus Obscuribacterales bacterium]